MSLTLRTCVVIFVFPLLAFAQSSERQIFTETDLVTALCDDHATPSSRRLLLEAHPQLVNTRLWNELADRAAAAYNRLLPEQSVAIYEVAIEIANHLREPRMVAETLYKLGRTYFGLKKFSKAIEAYQKSKEYFEESGSRRDLIYIHRIIRRPDSTRSRALRSPTN